MLTQQHRQEALSRAYIHAVTGKLGLNCLFYNFDYGIDVTVSSLFRYEGRIEESGFKLDIQAKSSINATVKDDYVHYALEVRAYDMLRRIECGCPRILVLLLLPEDEKEWLDQNEERLILRKCAYWASLKGRGELDKNQTRVTIRIPRVNLFTVEGLREIMIKVERGVEL